MSRSASAISILRLLFIGVNIVVIALKKYCGGNLPAPLGAAMQFWITELRRIISKVNFSVVLVGNFGLILVLVNQTKNNLKNF